MVGSPGSEAPTAPCVRASLAARTAALYARRHGYAYAFFDTTAALLELGRGATRQFPAEWGVATVLAQCTWLWAARPAHQATLVEMEPYISAAMAAPRCWAAQTQALRLRVRVDGDAPRRRHRALMQLQALFDDLRAAAPAGSAATAPRLHSTLFHGSCSFVGRADSGPADLVTTPRRSPRIDRPRSLGEPAVLGICSRSGDHHGRPDQLFRPAREGRRFVVVCMGPPAVVGG